MSSSAAAADDDEFRALFGDRDDPNADLEPQDIDGIKRIQRNDPNFDAFAPWEEIEELTDAAWERLGSYIAGNDHLRRIDLSECSLGVALFRGVASAKGGSLRGIVKLSCEDNRGIDSTCFDLLINAIDGGAIEILDVGCCSINNPMALARCALPNLQHLKLNNNGITDLPPEALAKLTHLQSLSFNDNKLGEGAFRAIADMLRNEECSLKHLQLQRTRMNATVAIMLADSLRCNTKLVTLGVSGNRIGDEGKGAFLKLLNDVSSIKSTERSNHTLQSLGFSNGEEIRLSIGVMKHVHNALEINIEHEGNPEAAGKTKVRETQLHKVTRDEFARLQGIEFPTHHQLFSDLDPVLLPNVLELAGEHNPYRNELYPAIVGNASDLVSLIDREAMLRGEEMKNEARIAAITAELARLNGVNARIRGQLISIETEKRVGHASGNKRGRDEVAEK